MQSTEVQSAASSSPKPQKSAFANIDEFLSAKNIIYHHHHNCFTALFSGTTRMNRCQKRTSGLYGAGGD